MYLTNASGLGEQTTSNRSLGSTNSPQNLLNILTYGLDELSCDLSSSIWIGWLMKPPSLISPDGTPHLISGVYSVDPLIEYGVVVVVVEVIKSLHNLKLN